ncbi:MAG: NAD(P)/FAD-dependent oxidoreductase [bacterium]
MTSKKKVLISGAGIAGLLTYIYLDRSKYEMTLIEKGEQFRSVGYAITIWSCGYDLLKRTLMRRGAYENRFIKLKRTLMLNESTFPESLYSLKDLGYIVDREAFHDMLLAEARNMEGRMILDTAIPSTVVRDGKHIVTLSTGQNDAYDLVVVAEGISSLTRSGCFEGVGISPSDYAVEYAEIERIPMLEGENVVFGINNMTGVLMTSPTSAMIAHFFFAKEPEYAAQRDVMREGLEKMLVRIYGPQCRPVYRGTTRVFELKDVHVPNSHANRMILLGDAAHGRLPVLGVGTTLATEDAFYLARSLNQLDGDSWSGRIEILLEEFSRARNKRVEQLYALQDVVIKNSLPRANAVRKEYGPFAKRMFNTLGILSNRLFTVFFRRAVSPKFV